MSIALVTCAAIAVFFVSQINQFRRAVASRPGAFSWGFIILTAAAVVLAWQQGLSSPAVDITVGALLGLAVAGHHRQSMSRRAAMPE